MSTKIPAAAVGKSWDREKGFLLGTDEKKGQRTLFLNEKMSAQEKGKIHGVYIHKEYILNCNFINTFFL